jgi:uncharacterized metal-binding protein YceD (DUF177 family)
MTPEFSRPEFSRPEFSRPEFSRRVTLDQIGAGGHKTGINATDDECAALARRFGWIRIDSLTATANLLARAGGVDALGTLNAAIERACVASGDPVHETVEEAFAIHFVHEQPDAADVGEIELDEDELDIVEFDGAAIDIGEAVAQTLALSVDPFPRSPGAQAQLRAAGVLAEGDVGNAVFAGLKGLLKG